MRSSAAAASLRLGPVWRAGAAPLWGRSSPTFKSQALVGFFFLWLQLQRPISFPPHHAAAVTPADKMAAAPSSRPFEYLESLAGTVFYKLYQQPSTALAIFRRMLPDLGMCRMCIHHPSASSTDCVTSKMLCHGTSLPEGSAPRGGSGGLG